MQPFQSFILILFIHFLNLVQASQMGAPAASLCFNSVQTYYLFTKTLQGSLLTVC